MSKEKKSDKTAPVRFIFKKDVELTMEGYLSYEAAKQHEGALLSKLGATTHRVRTRHRSRTNTWDVVVKVKTEAKDVKPLTKAQIQDAKDLEFVSNHALTGE